MIRVFPFGGYRNRQPLAYEPIRAALGDRIAMADAPDEAQILLISHFADLDLFGARIQALLDRWPQLRLVLLSEEPFWDGCWMPDPFTRRQRLRAGTGAVDCIVLNHETSGMFRAARVPYFLLTDTRYIAHYRSRFTRNAGFSAQDWARHFTLAPMDAVFVATRRTSARLARVHQGDRLRGLSIWRSQIAAACQGPRVVIEGQGWAEGPRRQDLDDWHADKLDRFDLQTRYMAAFENTYQRDYLTEKIWDAFAVGAVPLYAAGPDHAAGRLIGPAGWCNYFGAFDTVPVIEATRLPDRQFVDAYAAVQQRLAALFSDAAAIDAEYQRFAAALLDELQGALNG